VVTKLSRNLFKKYRSGENGEVEERKAAASSSIIAARFRPANTYVIINLLMQQLLDAEYQMTKG
jgi:hypothetical protein